MSGCKSKKEVEALPTSEIIEEEEDETKVTIEVDNLDKIISIEEG